MPLATLSEKEHELYDYVDKLKGSCEEITEKLIQENIISEYREVHKQYLELYTTTKEESIKNEALKRLIFLNWY
jgi:hypothetical protein